MLVVRGRVRALLLSSLVRRGYASATTNIEGLNPRKLTAQLDQFVVGQERAKKVLSVAVFNHYSKLNAAVALSASAAATSASTAVTTPQSSSPLDEEATAVLKPPPIPKTSKGGTTGKGLFDRSYAPSSPTDPPSSTSTQRRKPSKLSPPSSSTTTSHDLSSTTEDPSIMQDPTLYDNHPPPSSDPPPSTPPTPTPKRRAAAAVSSSPSSTSSPSSEILTDFIGQVPGSSLPPPLPPRPSPQAQKPPPFFEKSNILLLGPTGSGKSLLARTLASTLRVPFISLEATGLTMAGYVGEDVESCISRLLMNAEWDVEKAERGVVFIDEVDKIARSGGGGIGGVGSVRDVGGEGVQQALLKILEGTVVQVPDREESQQTQGRKKRGSSEKEIHLVDTTNILFILSGAFVGLERIIKNRLEKSSIGFGARLLPPSSPSSTSTSSSSSSSTPAPTLNPLDNLEPSDLIQYGFIPEFIGRLPILTPLHPLSLNDLLRVLTEPKNALTKQYEHLFGTFGCELRFTRKALLEVAVKAEKAKSGARGLRAVLEKVLLEAMFDTPQSSIRYVLINEAVVQGLTPAHYYSRGQHHLFQAAFEEEEGESSPAEGEESVGEEQEEEDLVVEKKLRRATA